MKLELTTKQFRRLLDMAYIGNWILNSTRGDDRFKDYDDVESLLFAKAREEGMGVLAEDWQGEVVPSRAFAEGGIHEAIMEYENNVFFDILAEDLAAGIWRTLPSTRTTMRSCPAALTPILPSSSSTALTTFWWTATSYRPDTQGRRTAYAVRRPCFVLFHSRLLEHPGREQGVVYCVQGAAADPTARRLSY